MPTSLRSIDDLQIATGIEDAGIAGFDEAIFRDRFLGLLVVCVVADEHARRFELHLAIVGDADLDIRNRLADRISVDLAIFLGCDIEEGLRLPVKLLEVDAQ